MSPSHRVVPIACLMVLAVTGCARYRPLPLDPSRRYADAIVAPDRTVGASQALSEADVVALVLRDNPSLRLAALKHREAADQGRASARPPNPSFSGNVGYLLSGVGDAKAWTAGLAQGIDGWITLRARRDEADASVKEVDASLAWEAWQDVGKARLLVTDIVLNESLHDVQAEWSNLLDRQWQAVRDAKARGDLDATAASPVALAADEARQASDETERTLVAQRRELTALMGVSADATVHLTALPSLSSLDAGQARAAVAAMPSHRPDLVALAMGYAAEDARVRQAILSQFPPLTIGYDASRDNSRVTNGGPAISLDLPVFDRGTTHVDAAQATRQRLHDEYGIRVADAVDEADALMKAYRLAESQLDRSRRFVADAAQKDAEAQHALQRGDLDRNTYTDLAVASLSRRASLIRNETRVREQRIALETLLGIGMPEIHHEAS